MEPWAREFLDAYTAAIPDAAQALLDSLNKDPTRKGQYKLDDMAQVLQGGLAMAREYLEQGTTEIRDTYVNTVIPGMIAQGETPEMVVSQSYFAGIIQTVSIFAKIRPEFRREATEFWAWWGMQYMREQYKVAVECAGAP
ncbi:hypothetical protein [Polyangium sp. y55x31]|uniref:hypothetical protein n=1 Tax=Polyangium sp. y55x31 TaxID=3042688 RepID=UPI00248218F7|nr:hypothetical protein [Polyangium sp. y55x31]MDI1477093.1 hypothetical protein [Polyangium sp. y55x31]